MKGYQRAFRQQGGTVNEFTELRRVVASPRRGKQRYPDVLKGHEGNWCLSLTLVAVRTSWLKLLFYRSRETKLLFFSADCKLYSWQFWTVVNRAGTWYVVTTLLLPVPVSDKPHGEIVTRWSQHNVTFVSSYKIISLEITFVTNLIRSSFGPEQRLLSSWLPWVLLSFRTIPFYHGINLWSPSK